MISMAPKKQLNLESWLWFGVEQTHTYFPLSSPSKSGWQPTDNEGEGESVDLYFAGDGKKKIDRSTQPNKMIFFWFSAPPSGLLLLRCLAPPPPQSLYYCCGRLGIKWKTVLSALPLLFGFNFQIDINAGRIWVGWVVPTER